MANSYILDIADTVDCGKRDCAVGTIDFGMQGNNAGIVDCGEQDSVAGVQITLISFVILAPGHQGSQLKCVILLWLSVLRVSCLCVASFVHQSSCLGPWVFNIMDVQFVWSQYQI